MAPDRASASTATLLSAHEAASRLGVSKATLYAYVSRGRLSAVPDPTDPRARRYSSFEVEMASRRQSAGRRREQQTLAALNEGWPVLDTALSCVLQGQPIYRGHNVLALARSDTVENVARLLWQFGPHDPFDADVPVLGDDWQAWARNLRARQRPLPERMLALFALALPQLHGPVWLADGAPLARACGQHLRVAMACFLGRPPQTMPLHRQFVQAWRLPARAAEPLRQALVMAADHEMNMLAFTARGLASVGATLGASLLGGLCNTTATFNGGATAQVEALWDEVAAQPQLAQAVARRLDRGEGLPGFNHMSYPAGDPRAQALLTLCDTLDPLTPATPLAGVVHQLTGWKPSIDFALVALRRALGAPADAALALQMAGRCVGMLAHILEQRRSGQRIVVKARYVGPEPAPNDTPTSGAR